MKDQVHTNFLNIFEIRLFLHSFKSLNYVLYMHLHQINGQGGSNLAKGKKCHLSIVQGCRIFYASMFSRACPLALLIFQWLSTKFPSDYRSEDFFLLISCDFLKVIQQLTTTEHLFSFNALPPTLHGMFPSLFFFSTFQIYLTQFIKPFVQKLLKYCLSRSLLSAIPQILWRKSLR